MRLEHELQLLHDGTAFSRLSSRLSRTLSRNSSMDRQRPPEAIKQQQQKQENEQFQPDMKFEAGDSLNSSPNPSPQPSPRPLPLRSPSHWKKPQRLSMTVISPLTDTFIVSPSSTSSTLRAMSPINHDDSEDAKDDTPLTDNQPVENGHYIPQVRDANSKWKHETTV